MQYCVDHPEEVSKLAKVKAQVSEVKGVMMENIEKVSKAKRYFYVWNVICFPRMAKFSEDLQVLDRGEKIELLVDKTENLRSQVCDCKEL